VTLEARSPADLHVRSDDAARADIDILGQSSTRIHASRLCDRTFHARFLKLR
jgi:hypothetical protein